MEQINNKFLYSFTIRKHIFFPFFMLCFWAKKNQKTKKTKNKMEELFGSDDEECDDSTNEEIIISNAIFVELLRIKPVIKKVDSFYF